MYMDSGLYLIHGDDYIAHIDDKVEMFDFLLSMAREAREQIATGRTPAALRVLAKYEKEAIEAFETWGIPESYIESGDEDELAELIENDLLPATEGCCDSLPCCLAADGYDGLDYDPDSDTGGTDDSEGSVAAELLGIAASLTNTANQALHLCSRVMEEEFAE